MKAMSLKLESRYPAAAELAKDIEHWLTVIEVRTRAEAAALDGKRFCRIAGPVESGAAEGDAVAAHPTRVEDPGDAVTPDVGAGDADAEQAK